MRIAIGSDHARVPLKETMIAELQLLGHQGVDRGAHATSQREDYRDSADAVGRVVLDCNAESAVLIRGSVVGASVAANIASRHSGRSLSRFLFGTTGRQAQQHERDFWVHGSSGQNWRWTWCASSLEPAHSRGAPRSEAGED